ncbi:MAG: DUF1553 domain-containing protein [Planctomycetaceae bacterium]
MYRYRDYVIQSFNQDKPYSRFLVEQIAGDELVDYQSAAEINQETYDCLVATGFLRTAPDRTFANITNFVPDRLEVISDEMDILGSAVMGLTIKCARCHSHKFDPIPQRDYYRLTAIFKEAYDEHDWLKSQGERTLPHVMSAERAAYEKIRDAENEKIELIRTQLEQLKNETTEKLREQNYKLIPPEESQLVIAALSTGSSERTEEQLKVLDKHQHILNFTSNQLKEQDPEFGKQCDALEKQIMDLETNRKPEPRIRALWSRGSPSPSYILKRGNYLTPGLPVQPGVPEVLTSAETSPNFSSVPVNGKPGGNRLVFAEWLTRRDNPLTARVMVNRIWAQYFGNGIVNTPGNFGFAGSKPSHPELLDWLAMQFIESGWSFKAMHRLIVTSETYRQSSSISDRSAQLDPEGTLLSHMPLKRMDGEVLRDSILYVSGQLDESMYGPGVPVDVRADGLVTTTRSELGWRRSIYVLQRRTQVPTILENFDYPQMGPNCISRKTSLVPTQAAPSHERHTHS